MLRHPLRRQQQRISLQSRTAVKTHLYSTHKPEQNSSFPETHVLLMGNKVDRLTKSSLNVSSIIRDTYDHYPNFTFAEVSCKYDIEQAIKVFKGTSKSHPAFLK